VTFENLLTYAVIAAPLLYLLWIAIRIWRGVSPLQECQAARARGDMPAAQRWAELAIQSARNELEEAAAREELGGVYRFNGAAREAIQCYRRVLELRQKNLPADSPDIGTSFGNLGQALLAASEVQEGEASLRRGWEIIQASPESEEQVLAHVMTALGQACAYVGKFEESAQLLNKAVSLTQKIFGDDHARTAEALQMQAIAAAIAGQFRQADLSYLKSETCFARVNGHRHVTTLVTRQVHTQLLVAWARLTGDADLLATANEMAETMVSGLTAEIGSKHYITAMGLATWSRVRCLMQDVDEAQKLGEEALQIVESELGPHHAGVGYCHIALARALAAAGSLTDAIRHALTAHSIAERCFGTDHFETGDSLELLGQLASRQNNLREAEKYLRRSLAVRDALGPNHPLRAFTLRELTPVLQALGHEDEAKYCRAVEAEIIESAHR